MSSTEGDKEDGLKSTKKDDAKKLAPYRSRLVKKLVDTFFRKTSPK